MKIFVIYAVAVISAALDFNGVFFVWGAFINPLLPGVFQACIHIVEASCEFIKCDPSGVGEANWNIECHSVRYRSAR